MKSYLFILLAFICFSSIFAQTGNVGIGITNPQKQLDISGSFQLPVTSDNSTGIIFKGGAPFLHDYKPSGANGWNTFLGINSGNFNMSGTTIYSSYNTGIGGYSLFSNTTGRNNTALGYKSLFTNSSGEYNTAIGHEALFTNSTGKYNCAVGNKSLYNNSTGEGNTAIGLEAAKGITTGNYNVVIGADADVLNQGGSNNTVIGFGAGYVGSYHSKSGNIFLGYKAGFYESGSNKLYIDNSDTVKPLIGGDFSSNELYVNGRLGIGDNTPAQQLEISQSLQMPHTEQSYGNYGIIYKNNARFMHNSPGELGYCTYLGMEAGRIYPPGTGYVVTFPDPMKYNTGVGYQAFYGIASGSHNTAIGSLSQRYNENGYANTSAGSRALYQCSGSESNTAIGTESLYNINASFNTAIGAFTLRSNINGAGNVALGYQAGYNETGSNKLYIENSSSSTPLIGGDFSQDEVYIFSKLGVGTNDPDQALEVNGSFELPVSVSSSSGIIFKGGVSYLHDYKSPTAIGQNTFLGMNAGNFTMNAGANYQASSNTGIGASTLHNLTTGYANSALGSYALPAVQSGYENSAVGLYALFATTGGLKNCALGAYAGKENTTGNNNLVIGYEANYYNQTGSNNTIIGHQAGKGSSGNSKSGNVFIGYNAGLSENGSNKLYISNTSTSSPLIGGNFSESEVYINSKMGINTSDPQANLDVNGNIILQNGVAVNEFSSDATLSGGSNSAVPTELAVKTYADNLTTGFFPIGSIIAWAKNLTGVPALSSKFVECNGQTLSDPESPLNGQVIPNLNASGGGSHRYLRGSTSSGSTGGSLSHSHNINGQLTGGPNMLTIGVASGSGSYSPAGHQHFLDNIPTDPTETEPPYYNVVWIMRVK